MVRVGDDARRERRPRHRHLVEVDVDHVVGRLQRDEADGEAGVALRVHLRRDVVAARADRDLQVALARLARVNYCAHTPQSRVLASIGFYLGFKNDIYIIC